MLGFDAMSASEDFFVPVETKTSGGVLHDSSASTMDWSSTCSTNGPAVAGGGEATYSSSGLLGADMERGVSLRSLKRRSRRTSGDRARVKGAEMSLAAGGSMRQKLYPDTHGIEVWDQENSSKMFVHIVNSQMYEQITGEKPPATLIDAQTYAKHGYPWFDLWDEEMADIQAPSNLAGVLTVSQLDKVKGIEGQQDDSAIVEKHVIKHKVKHGKVAIRDGKW
jgi:hypothetical protein